MGGKSGNVGGKLKLRSHINVGGGEMGKEMGGKKGKLVVGDYGPRGNVRKETEGVLGTGKGEKSRVRENWGRQWTRGRGGVMGKNNFNVRKGGERGGGMGGKGGEKGSEKKGCQRDRGDTVKNSRINMEKSENSSAGPESNKMWSEGKKGWSTDS